MAKGKKKKKRKKLPPLLKVLLIVVCVLIVGYCVFLGLVYKYIKRVDEVQKESMDEFANVFITQLEDENVLADRSSLIEIKEILDGNEHPISDISTKLLLGEQIIDAYNGRSYEVISSHCVHDSTACAMLSIIYHSDSNEIELLLRNDYVNNDSIIKKEIYSLDKDISEYLK